MDSLPRVIVSEHCPPGQALIIDVARLGVDPDAGKLYVFHPEQHDAAIAVEDALDDLARRGEFLRGVAALVDGIAEAIA